MRILIFLCLFLGKVSASDPIQINPDQFQGEFTTEDGENLYIHMELIQDEKWRTYYHGTMELNPLFISLATQCYAIKESIKQIPSEKIFETLSAKFKLYGTDQTGYKPQELKGFLETLTANCSNDGARTERLVSNINLTDPGAAGGFITGSNFFASKRFVIYISASKDFPDRKKWFMDTETGEKIDMSYRFYSKPNLKRYIEEFSPVILSVTSKEFNEGSTHVFENRGIFKNPYWILQNKYKDLSMKLHGFVAAVSRKFFKTEWITVKPLGAMKKILINKMGPNIIRYQENGKVPLTQEITSLPFASESIPFDTMEKERFFIPTKDLEKFYFTNR